MAGSTWRRPTWVCAILSVIALVVWAGTYSETVKRPENTRARSASKVFMALHIIAMLAAVAFGWVWSRARAA